MEPIAPEIINLIWFAGVGIIGYAVFHKFSDVIKLRIKTGKTNVTKNYANEKNIDGQLENFLESAPRILAEIQMEIKKQKEAGVTDQQMSGLMQKTKMLEFVVQNKELIDIIGKPILKKLVGFIKAI